MKVKSKGTVLKLDISSVLTAVSQLISVTPPKRRTLDFDSTTLDTTLGKEKELTGYAEADPFEAELFWDPALAVQAAIDDLIDPTPTASTWQIVFANTDASELDFDCAGIELGEVVAMDDGVKQPIKGNIDGLPALTAAP